MVGVHKLPHPRGDGTTYDIHRDHPCILVGSQKGKRPVLRLEPKAGGFDSPDKRACAVVEWWGTQGASCESGAPGA
jgi:hypothetical protein